MKKSMRTEIMTMANDIRRSTKTSRSVALSKAWQLHRLQVLLQQGVAQFAYYKEDGSMRKATGTLKVGEEVLNKERNNSNKTYCYYDLNASGIRSFRLENLITIYE